MNCSASRSGVIGTKSMKAWDAEYDNDVLVFDTLELKWGRARRASSSNPKLLPEGCGDFPMVRHSSHHWHDSRVKNTVSQEVADATAMANLLF